MNDILEIPEVRRHASPLSVAEYHQLGEFNENGRRTELIRGIVLEKTAKSPLHCSIASRLFKLILSKTPPGFSVWKEEPLTLADSEPEPDVSVVRGGDADFTAAHPHTAELVIEVAVSSPALDRASATLYAEAAVKEYWIVLAGRQAVEVYRQPEDGVYREMRLHVAGETLTCASVPGISFGVDEIVTGT